MAIFGTASSPFFSITFLLISALCLENFTDSTTAHPSLPHTTWNVWRRGSTDSWRPSSKWISPGAGELGPRGPGSWGASFIQIEVCSWFFGVIFGDVGDVFGIVTWDCCERFFGGMNLKGVVFLSDFGDVAFYYSGGSLGFFYESHVFDHLVRHDLCENTKKNTGWVDSWLLSLCSVWKSGSCTNIPCGAARFSVQCPPVCRENMRKQLVDKFWYVPLKLEIFQISFH